MEQSKLILDELRAMKAGQDEQGQILRILLERTDVHGAEIKKMNSKIDKLEEKLNDKINKLDAKIDNVEEKLNDKIDKLDAKIDNVYESIEEAKDDLSFLKQMEGRNFADIAKLKAIK